MNKFYKLIDRATTNASATFGALAVLHGTYELIATGVFYWHIFAIGAAFLAVAGASRKEAHNG